MTTNSKIYAEASYLAVAKVIAAAVDADRVRCAIGFGIEVRPRPWSALSQEEQDRHHTSALLAVYELVHTYRSTAARAAAA